MRRACAAQTALGVLLAFICAPLLHVHLPEPGHAHDGQPVHHHEAVIHVHFPPAHFVPGTAAHDANVHDPSHNAKPLDTSGIAPTKTQAPAVPFVVEWGVDLAPAPVSFARLILESLPRTHDPPLLDRASPRAPPA